MLFVEFAVRSQELPALFDPKSPAVALRPSVAALKRCVALLSGTATVRGQDPATDEVFAAPDAFGWAYQYWNADEKDRVSVKPGTSKKLTIKFDRAGKLEIACHQPNHYKLGMRVPVTVS